MAWSEAILRASEEQLAAANVMLGRLAELRDNLDTKE